MPKSSDLDKFQLWEKRLAEFRSRPVSVQRFCRSLGVSQAQFYYWKRKLSPNGSRSTRRIVDRRSIEGHPPLRRSFLPVVVNSERAHEGCLSISLPSGVTIRVPVDAR
jgi:transposase-like protein